VTSALAAVNTIDSVLQTSGGEVVTATYTDATNVSPGSSTSRTTTATMSTSSAGETVQLVNSSGSDATQYTIGTDSVYIKITDADENANTGAEETITVTLTNPTTGFLVAGTGDTMILTLLESGINTGIFQYESGGTVTGITLKVASKNTADSILQVIDGSTIELSYTDTDTSATTKDTALAVTSAASSLTVITDSVGLELNTLSIGTHSIYVQVTDSDEDTDPGSAQTISVTVTESKSGDLEVITLGETGNNTGVFRNTGGLTISLATEDPAQGNGTLETQDGATITASYTDNDDSSDSSNDTATAKVTASTSSTSFTTSSGIDVISYKSTADLVYVTVTDTDENSSGTTQESITVTVTSSVAGDSETINLKETQNNSGIFRNASGIATKVSSSGTAGDGTLQISSGGDTLTASYTDVDDASDTTSDTATVGAISFRVEVSGLTQEAGTSFVLTITAVDGVDGVGNTLTTFNGSVDLSVNYIDPVSGADKLTPDSASNFSEGIASITASYPNAGVITITAKDTLDSFMTGTSGQITFYPASFGVAVSSATQTVNKAFSLTLTALNAQGATTTYYSGKVNLKHTNVSPDTKTGTLTPSTVVATEFANGVAKVDNVNFDRWGNITITATDNVRANATGTSSVISFLPNELVLAISQPPASRPFFYENEPFDTTLYVYDAKKNIIPNYGGKISFAQASGIVVSPAAYTFTTTDGGVHLFSAWGSEGEYVLKAQDTAVSNITGQSSGVEVKFGKVIVEGGRGPVGVGTVGLKVIDGSGNIITEDNSTTINVVLTEEFPNTSALSPATSRPVSLRRGRAQIAVSNDEAETVTIIPASKPFLATSPGQYLFGVLSNEGVKVDYWLSLDKDARAKQARGR